MTELEGKPKKRARKNTSVAACTFKVMEWWPAKSKDSVVNGMKPLL